MTQFISPIDRLWRRQFACALGVTAALWFNLAAALATEPGKTQHLASLDTVPQGMTASDWANIRAAYQAGRHAAAPVDGGYRARNPEQQWCTQFNGRGFLTQPDAGGWSWGLELKDYGFKGQERTFAEASKMTAEGSRVTYERDAGLKEWFVNDQRGLEHGFTVQQRPAGFNHHGRLQFELAVRGDLRPQVSSDGESVQFVDAKGAAVVNYTALKVWDADGKILSSRFEVDSTPAIKHQTSNIKLSIDERGARYPITIDPIAQQAYLKASNPGAGDRFGRSVAISGGTVIIGAYQESSNATGVDGNQADNSVADAGAAYIFARSGSTWTQQAYLKASNTDAGDFFGVSVAISGDTAIVGAYAEDSNATGVNGDQADNSATYAGAAYVFVRSGSAWTQQAYLKASNTDANDFFGVSVAISGDTAIVGAYGESSNATGVNGSQTDNSLGGAGAAYVFVRSGSTWTQQTYLKASNTDAGDTFGFSVAISGDTAIVGAYNEFGNGIDGENDNSAFGAGAAYVFVRSGSAWTQQAYLKASNTDAFDQFGFSVAISGDTAIVGAFTEFSNARGVNGDQTDNSATYAGAAYVFVRSGSTWTQQAYLKASNTDAFDYFGFSVAISSDTAIVGASGESSNATGVNGNQTDNSVPSAGAAYAFARNGTTWSQQAYLKASNTDGGDFFGTSVAISGDTAIVGAPDEDSNATGVNGDQADNTLDVAGAAYVFTGLPTLANRPCPHAVSYWKNNPALWPVTSLTLGSQSYSKAELLGIVKSSVTGDASVLLARQLIAAKLNIANGSDGTPINSTITHADSLLSAYAGKLPYRVKTSSSMGKAMLNDTGTLSNYNSGLLTPVCAP